MWYKCCLLALHPLPYLVASASATTEMLLSYSRQWRRRRGWSSRGGGWGKRLNALTGASRLHAGFELDLESPGLQGRLELVDHGVTLKDGVDLGLPELQEAGQRGGARRVRRLDANGVATT